VLKLQAPEPLAVTLPSEVAPSKISTLLLPSTVPLRTRVLSPVMPSPSAPVSVA